MNWIFFFWPNLSTLLVLYSIIFIIIIIIIIIIIAVKLSVCTVL